jgi:hypothetical protein
MGRKLRRRLATALVIAAAALLGVSAGLIGASAAPADGGWITGTTEPPIDPGQGGNPVPTTITYVPIPDVPSSVPIDLGLPSPPPYSPPRACKQAHKGAAAAAKKCRKKRK